MFETLNAKIDGLGAETKEIRSHVVKIETTLEHNTNKKSNFSRRDTSLLG